MTSHGEGGGDLAALPEWERRAAGLLIVTGPHAMPVSTAVRAGDRRLVFGLARRRETLARLREDPHAAFALLARGMAFTAYGDANVIREKLDGAPNMAGVELRVERVQNHLADGRTEMLSAAGWRWRQEEAREADRTVVAAIEALARARASRSRALTERSTGARQQGDRPTPHLSPHTVMEHASALYRKLGSEIGRRPFGGPSDWG